MLVLGKKYKFTELEYQFLQRKNYTLDTVLYSHKDPQKVLEEIKTLLKEKSKNLIIINTRYKVDKGIIKFLTTLQFQEDIEIITIETFLETYLHKCYIPDDHKNLDYLNDIKPFSKRQYILKRCIDYFGVFWLLFFSWPVMLLSVKKIKEQSPGPVLYKQLRVGVKNKEFHCTKFRSMQLDAEKDGAKFASQNDARIFKWGETMRKTRLDELPQMVNILKGEMHLIGPRPERKVWTEQFEITIPYYAERHLVAPGITGWAQVMYPYGANAEDAKQKLMYDLYYIKYWSIALELKIVWKTAMTVIGKQGL